VISLHVLEGDTRASALRAKLLLRGADMSTATRLERPDVIAKQGTCLGGVSYRQ
jgi:hypothetical protein